LEPTLALLVAPELTIEAGDSHVLAVRVERINCSGPVTRRLDGFGAGLDAKEGRIEEGQSEGRLRVSADSATTSVARGVLIGAEADGVRTTKHLRVIVTRTSSRAPLGMTFVKLPKRTFYMGGGGGTKGKPTVILEDFEISVYP
jgi:hypothetical protein